MQPMQISLKLIIVIYQEIRSSGRHIRHVYSYLINCFKYKDRYSVRVYDWERKRNVSDICRDCRPISWRLCDSWVHRLVVSFANYFRISHQLFAEYKSFQWTLFIVCIHASHTSGVVSPFIRSNVWSMFQC